MTYVLIMPLQFLNGRVMGARIRHAATTSAQDPSPSRAVPTPRRVARARLRSWDRSAARFSNHATWHPPTMTRLRTVTTAELTRAELEALRELLFGAFGGRFEEHDWEHTLGGVHVLASEDDQVVAHGAVVPRTLAARGRELRTGYVEGVATRSDRRGRGLATLVMREVGRVVEGDYELGALSDGTGIPGFYQRRGWETWQGPTFVAGPRGRERTATDDGSVLVLRTPATGALDVTGSITCDWRPGDVW
jgi:aminoglycoside 2'-N-acetyltransferase I